MDDAPLGRCPAHPEVAAWRVCRRCGRFLCARCTCPTVKGPLCPDCFAPEAPPDRFQSPPVLVALAVIPLLLQLLTLVLFLVARVRDLGAQPLPWAVYETMSVVLPSAAAARALPDYFRRLRRARRRLVQFFGVVLVLRLVDVGFEFANELLMAPSLVGAGLAAVWVAYFGWAPAALRYFDQDVARPSR